jgi:hypothetical protein
MDSASIPFARNWSATGPGTKSPIRSAAAAGNVRSATVRPGTLTRIRKCAAGISTSINT